MNCVLFEFFFNLSHIKNSHWSLFQEEFAFQNQSYKVGLTFF